MENIVGVITNVSASYYSILMTVVFALFGTWSYLTSLFWGNKKLRTQKKIWILCIVALVANIAGIYFGFDLFSILQDIALECFNGCRDVKLRLSDQRLDLKIQIISIICSSLCLGIFGFLVKREKHP